MKNLIPILLIAGVFTLSFAAGTGSISGVVTDSVTGNPIVGARVCAMRGGNTITNESGEYLIENLTPGDYRVTASAEGYCGKTYPDMVTVVDGQTTTNINFALAPCVPPPRGSISGVVTDSVTGNPIVGARVSVMRGGYAITNQNGEYAIENLRPGSYQVRASAAGYTPKVYPEPVIVIEGQITPNINFALAPFVPPQPGSISGIVADAKTGNPIAGAVVNARTMIGNHHRNVNGRAITNPDGTYIIENLLPGDYRVMANAGGYTRQTYPELVVVTAGHNTPNINFSLTPAPQIQRMRNQVRPPTNK